MCYVQSHSTKIGFFLGLIHRELKCTLPKLLLTQTFYTAEYSKFTHNSNFTLAKDTWRVMAVKKDIATKYEKASFAAAYHFIVYEKKGPS